AGGARLLSFVPYDATVPVQWVGWSGGGRLLTLGGGKLTGWEVPAGKAAFEVAGGYRLPARTVRGGGWLAVAAAAHVDLVDAETGRCLGRCSLAEAEHDPTRPADVALATDGRMLVFAG